MSEEIQVTDAEVVEAMCRYGGGFVLRLGMMAQVADPANLDKIKETWPHYWRHYTAMAKMTREREEGK